MWTNVHASPSPKRQAGSFDASQNAAMTTIQDAMTKGDADKQGKGIETEEKRATYKH